MVRTPARLAGLVVAGFVGAGFALAGCPFETGGLVGASTASSSTGSSTASTGSAGTGGHGGSGMSSSTSSGAGGTGGVGGDAGNDGGTDAPPDAPVEAGPLGYASCLEWLTAHPNATNGVFMLRDGVGDMYDAYCDMGNDGDGGDAGNAGAGGGWTLVLKVDGKKNTFPYGNALWTSTDPLNANMPELDQNEAKLASYWSVPFTAMRLGMIDGGTTRWLVVPIAGSSLLDLINLPTPTPSNLGIAAWEGLLANGSIQHTCNWQGINPDPLMRLRIGLVGDESSDCATNPSPDSFIGFGSNGQFQSNLVCGNVARDQDDHGDQTTQTFGYVLVR